MKLKILLLAVISGSLLMCSKSSDAPVFNPIYPVVPSDTIPVVADPPPPDSICHVVVDSRMRRSSLSFFFGESPAEGYLIEFSVQNSETVKVKGQKCELLADGLSGKPKVLTDSMLVDGDAGDWRSNPMLLSDVNGNNGPFDGLGERYLGFRVLHNNFYQYGWFRLVCDPAKAVIRILDYGINLYPNSPIKCGDTGNLGQCENWPLVNQILNPDHVYPGPYKPLGSAGNDWCDYSIEFIDDPVYDFKLSPLPCMSVGHAVYGILEYGQLKIDYTTGGTFYSPGGSPIPYIVTVKGFGFYYEQNGKHYISMSIKYNRDVHSESFDGWIKYESCQ